MRVPTCYGSGWGARCSLGAGGLPWEQFWLQPPSIACGGSLWGAAGMAVWSLSASLVPGDGVQSHCGWDLEPPLPANPAPPWPRVTLRLSLDLRSALHPAGKSGLKRRNCAQSPDAAFPAGGRSEGCAPNPQTCSSLRMGAVGTPGGELGLQCGVACSASLLASICHAGGLVLGDPCRIPTPLMCQSRSCLCSAGRRGPRSCSVTCPHGGDRDGDESLRLIASRLWDLLARSKVVVGQGGLPSLTMAQAGQHSHLETGSAMATSSGRVPLLISASPSPCVTLNLCSWDGRNCVPRPGWGSPQPQHPPLERIGSSVRSLLSHWDAVQLHLRSLYSRLLARSVLLFLLDLLG